MVRRSAVLFLRDDTIRTGSEKPLMLQNVMGVPLLRWLSHALRTQQVERFFLVCGPGFAEQAAPCFPEGSELHIATDENSSDLLHVFLSTADESEQDVLVVTGPVLYVPERALNRDKLPNAANACMVSRVALMDALDETAPIGQFLRRSGDVCTDHDGFYSVYSPWELAEWQQVLKRSLLRQLTESGVEIWDYASTYIEPGVEVGIGTVLLPGTILQGRTRIGYGCTIGPNTRLINARVGNHCRVEQSRLEDVKVGNDAAVGPFADLRQGTVLENKSEVGCFAELKGASLGQGARVPHLSYLGRAEVGANAFVGFGAATADFDRVAEAPTRIEADAFIGCGTTLVAPVTVGQGAYIGAGSVITEDVPAQGLGIARSRQQVRREWAIKNKTTEE